MGGGATVPARVYAPDHPPARPCLHYALAFGAAWPYAHTQQHVGSVFARVAACQRMGEADVCEGCCLMLSASASIMVDMVHEGIQV